MNKWIVKLVCVKPVLWQVIKSRATLIVGIAMIAKMAVIIVSIVAQKKIMRKDITNGLQRT